MKLFINTSNQEIITIGINGTFFETESRKDKSQRLLPFIIEQLEKQGASLTDISEIELATGPGSFTGIRVGAAVANTLAWQLGILVNGKHQETDIHYTNKEDR